MKFAGAVAGLFLCLIVSIPPIFANEEGKHGEGEGKKAETSLVQLDPFVVNVSSPTGYRFAKLGICLDLSSPALADKAKAKNGQIRDVVITCVTSKTAQDITSPEGRMQLKEELIDRINSVLGDKAVKSIYFTEVVVQ
ncbi:MAG: flagellar basal body-associated FliL family protein [Nitrospirae bacterium]|nr:flagellar basal body-associated FliL family protein [Nitrospirota bacterium]